MKKQNHYEKYNKKQNFRKNIIIFLMMSRDNKE